MGILAGLRVALAPTTVVVDNELAHDWCQELKQTRLTYDGSEVDLPRS